MTDLNEAVLHFRKELAAQNALSSEDIAELEAHVCDAMEDFSVTSLTEEEKFLLVTRRLGHIGDLSAEFQKVHPWATWKAPLYWISVGVAWCLGVMALVDLGLSVGLALSLQQKLSVLWQQGLGAFWLVACPTLGLAALGLMTRRLPSEHAWVQLAVPVSAMAAWAARIASFAVSADVNTLTWEKLDQSTWSDLQMAWGPASLASFLLVGGVGTVILVALRTKTSKVVLAD